MSRTPGPSDRLLLLQLSDTHIGADWSVGDPVAGLRATVAAVLALPQMPDAVLVSGDLVENRSDEEYALFLELLAPLGAPLHVLPGNHDDRGVLRRHFDLPGSAEEPVQYAADLGSLRLVALDSTRPGEDAGALDAERLDWLETELSAHPDAPTLIAMHHPPLSTGIPALDGMGLPAADRRALAELVASHDQVARLVAGHLHRTMVGEVGGRPVLVVPSTFAQMELDFDMESLALVGGAAGFAIHALRDGELVSHVQPVSYGSPAGPT